MLCVVKRGYGATVEYLHRDKEQSWTQDLSQALTFFVYLGLPDEVKERTKSECNIELVTVKIVPLS